MYDESFSLPALSSAIGSDTAVSDVQRDVTEGIGESRSSPESRRKKRKSETSAESEEIKATNSLDVDGKPPGLSYIALISMAIQSSSAKKMLLSEIYKWISEKYPYYSMKERSWRNSIRHNLSLNECFVKCGRSENGKGNYWSIHPANIEDFTKGDFRRRRARRQVRKCDEDIQRLCSRSPESEIVPVTSSVSTSGSHSGYVPMASTLVPANFLSAIGAEPVRSYDYWFPNQYATTQDHLMLNKTCTSDTKDQLRTDYSLQTKQHQYNTGYYYDRDSVAMSSFLQTEPTLNVNVNVNLCGNGGTETPRTDGYTCFDRCCIMTQPKCTQGWPDPTVAADNL